MLSSTLANFLMSVHMTVAPGGGEAVTGQARLKPEQGVNGRLVSNDTDGVSASHSRPFFRPRPPANGACSGGGFGNGGCSSGGSGNGACSSGGSGNGACSRGSRAN